MSLCANTDGAHQCSCPGDGYELDDTDQVCIGQYTVQGEILKGKIFTNL